MENLQKKNIKKPNSEGDYMSKTRYILYINDCYIYLLDNKTNKIIEKKCNHLKQDQITNEQGFYFEFSQFVRSNKIKIPIFGYKISVIINEDINEVQKNKYKEIFEDYFQKVDFIKITDILTIEKENAAMNLTKDYLDYYYLKKNENHVIRVNKEIFNNNDFKTISHVLNTIFTPQKIILFGSSNNIPKLTNKINKETGIQCAYQEEYTTYILNEYRKANTQ